MFSAPPEMAFLLAFPSTTISKPAGISKDCVPASDRRAGGTCRTRCSPAVCPGAQTRPVPSPPASCLSHRPLWRLRTLSIRPESESRTVNVSEGALENPKCPHKGAVPHPSGSSARRKDRELFPGPRKKSDDPGSSQRSADPSLVPSAAFRDAESRSPRWGRPRLPAQTH